MQIAIYTQYCGYPLSQKCFFKRRGKKERKQNNALLVIDYCIFHWVYTAEWTRRLHVIILISLLQNSFGRPDEIVAAETLANHVRCNNSFVHAVFQAQFRSSLTCPRCQRQSNTFDPFLCVSVPVPQNQRRPVYVTVLYTSQQPRQVKKKLSIYTRASQ